MNQGRRRNRKALLAIAALSGALFACEGEQVLVGTTRESLHLNVCMGAHTDCEPKLNAVPLTMPEPRSCAAPLGPALTPDFTISFSDLMCPDEPNGCLGTAQDLAVGADGTSWVLTAQSDGFSSSGTWLVRISAEGELLGAIDAMHGMLAPPNHSVRQETAMAMDERGHAFVLIYEQDGGSNADAPIVERTWLTEYDAKGEIARGPSLFTGIGIPQLSIATDGALLIAANGVQNARHGVLASLDTDGELLWSQNGVRTNGQGIGYGVVGLAATDYDAFVMAERSRASGGDFVDFGLTRYDADGNAIWDRVLEPLYTFATLVGAGEHLLFAAATFDHGQGTMANWAGRIDENGEVSWVYDLPGQGMDVGISDLAIDLNRDVALTARTGLGLKPELIALSLDGEHCARYGLPEDLNSLNRLAVDGAGAVHLMSNYSLARVRLPEE